MLTLDAIDTAARNLAERRREGRQGPLLPPDCRPTHLDEAWAIQQAVSQHLGWPVAGWKCALPQPARRVVAPIYEPTVQRAPKHHASSVEASVLPEASACPPCVARAHAGQVKVEPELAFVLGHDLPPRDRPYLPHEVDAAVAHTHLALELIDSRYGEQAEPSFEDKLADGLVNQGLFLGPEVDAAQACATVRMPITVDVPGQALRVLDGVHPDGHPRAPLHWLAEHLRQQGIGLRAGQVVITGSYAGSFWLPVGPGLRLQCGPLGQLGVQLLAARPGWPWA